MSDVTDFSFRGCTILNKRCVNGNKCNACQVAIKFANNSHEITESDRDNFSIFDTTVILGEVSIPANRTQTVGCIVNSYLDLLLKTASDVVSCEEVAPDSDVLKLYPLFQKVKVINRLGEPKKVLADSSYNKIAVFVYDEKSYLVAPQELVVQRDTR